MKKYLYISLIFMVSWLGCDEKEFFELQNPPEFPWLNMAELERGVVTPYNIALSAQWSNFLGNDRLLFDCMSDGVYLLPNTAADIPYDEMYLRMTDAQLNKTNGNFGDGYKCITHANSVLDFLIANDYEPFPNPSQNDLVNLDRMAGEMHFMRAYSYFYLTRRHCPVPGAPDFGTEEILPLRLETPLSAEAANTPEYVSTERIYQLIVDDLLRAKDLLPEGYLEGVHHPSYAHGRATRYAAAAMLARVYFQLGEYDKATPELDFAINGPFHLNEDPIEAFNRDNPTQGGEVIWTSSNHDRVIATTNKIPTSMNYSDYRVINGGRGEFHKRCSWNQFPMSHTILKQIGWMDENLGVTEEALQDKRYQQLYWRLEGNPGNNSADPTKYEMQYVHIKEPMVWGDKYYRGTEGQFTNIPIIRVAEMHLTRAIIRYMTGNTAGALEDVNIVRVRAGLEPLSELTEDDIHNERIKELSFEGDRYHYLQALRLPIPAGDRNTTPVEFPYENLRWKLPQSELDFKEGN